MTSTEHKLPERFRPQHINEAEMSAELLGRKHRYDGRTFDDCPYIDMGNISRWQKGWKTQDEIEAKR